MPSVILDRLPLPSLPAYTSVSILLLSCSVYYTLQVTSQPDWNSTYMASLYAAPESENATESIESVKLLQMMLMNNIITRRLYEIIYFMIQEPLCIWTLINMAYCCLILVGKCIQKIVFGELRVVEQQHIKDKFWNFVFYKFIFIFGVINVQYMEQVVLWCSWFSIIGFFHLLAQLSKDRFEYLSFSPTTPKWIHFRLLTLIFTILTASISLICIVGFYTSRNTFLFMAAECILVTLKTLHVLIRYILHLWDANHDGIWERKGIYMYYCELVFDLSCLIIDFLHHLHMLFWGHIILSMASLVICMQLRFLLNEIQRKLMRHSNYLKVARHIENNYPLATQEELDANSDDCAICWDRMDSARKLPCGHMFHISCLRSWLEQVTTCPTCRTALVNKDNQHMANVNGNHANLLAQDDLPTRPPNQTTNHFFHFDGSRYVSWFPSFSVEVSHTSLLGERQPPPIQTSQLDNMAHQVQQMFPNMPHNMILEDLRITRSVEMTVENIVEERLVPPAANAFPSISSSQDGSSSAVQSVASTSSQLPSTSAAESAPSSPAAADFPETENQRVVKTGGEGCRFSKSSSEREKMLALRKENLIRRARNKYISRLNLSRRCIGDSSSSSD